MKLKRQLFSGVVLAMSFSLFGTSPIHAVSETPAPGISYSFEGNLNDSNSASSLTLKPSCPASPCISTSSFGTENGDGYWSWGSSNPRGGGFTIDTDSPVGDTYSIAIKFSFDTVDGYNKIVDYKNEVEDTGFYIYDGSINFYDLGTGDDEFAPDTVLDLIATREDLGGGNGLFTVYAKSGSRLTQLLQVEDEDGQGIPAIVGGKSRLGFFFDDQATSSEGTANGRVYSIQMWPGVALTEDDVRTVVAAPSPLAPNEANGGLDPSSYLVTENGSEASVTLTRVDNSISLSSNDFSMAMEGTSPSGQPNKLDADGNLVITNGGNVNVSGTGFKANSKVKVYLLSTPILLGTVTTDADGAFNETLPIPSDIETGHHTLQANGYTTSGTVRSVSLGVVVPDVLPITGSSNTLLQVLLAGTLIGIGFFVRSRRTA